MALCGSTRELTILHLAAGILYLAQLASSANEFRRCYNTTDEMHCFEVQFDITNNRWMIATFDNARQRCNSLNSTLIIIRDQEINDIVLNYISDPASPIRFASAWTDAYRVSDYNNTYTWHWVNSSLTNLRASEVADTRDTNWYIASLEVKSQFHITAQQPHLSNSYVCEYEASKCPSSDSSVRQFDERCYVAVSASVSYYEARNRCLKDGGDLASFSNVSSVNFTTWLVSDLSVRYWIGLRNTWYIWKDTGLEVKFSKWILDNDWSALCLVTATCSTCGGSMNWRPMDCNTVNSNYVVCHSVTPLHTTALTTESATTLPVKTTASSTTQTESTKSGFTGSDLPKSGNKREDLSKIPLAVGIGVGVGVPVILAIIIVIICVIRRQRSKTHDTRTTRGEQKEEAFPTEVQTGKRDDSEMGHYAAIPSPSPSKPRTIEEETTSEIQYATLGFKAAADLKNDNGQSPLDVL